MYRVLDSQVQYCNFIALQTRFIFYKAYAVRRDASILYLEINYHFFDLIHTF